MSLNLQPKGGAADDAGGDDFRARLRKRREHLAKGSTKLFVLPFYDESNEALGGQLLARYRRLSFDEITAVFNGGEDIVAMNAQFLINACDELLFHDESGYHPLVPGHKTTYTINLETEESLATILGVEHLPSAKDQLIAAFGESEFALNDHSGEVHRWMISANASDGEQALGEA